MKLKDYFYDQMDDPNDLPWGDLPFEETASSAADTPPLMEEIPPPTDADCPPERDDFYPPEEDYGRPLENESYHAPFAGTPFDDGKPFYCSASAKPTHVDASEKPTHVDASAKPTHVDASAKPTHADASAKPTHVDAFEKPTHADASAKPTHRDAFVENPTPKPTHTDAFATIEGITQHCAAHMPSSCISFHPKLKMPVVDEWAFVKWFSEFAEIRCINYRFYLFGVKVDVGVLKRMMLEIVRNHAEITAPKLSGMLGLLESFTICPAPVVNAESLSFANKTLVLHHANQSEHAAAVTLRMQPPSDFSFCRVPHQFDPNVGEPTRLLAFLGGLFAPEDLPTVQEYLGYCLMPSTKAQKALFIIGKGGEGKSRLSVLMKLVLGEAAVVSSVAKISERFFPCMLENRLLFIDDDLQTTKFAATDAFKSLVTSETAIMVEQKGTPHYEMQPYARFLLMGNQSIGSLHDKSHGFYRRIHIIHTLPAPKGRVNNPTLIQDIWAAEQPEILLWLVKGALRLARQNYQLTESEASRAALAALKEEDNTALSFLKEQTFTYGAGCSVTSSLLTAKYKEWCLDNDLFKVGGQAFRSTCEAYFAKQDARYSNKIRATTGYVRGYTGVTLG